MKLDFANKFHEITDSYYKHKGLISDYNYGDRFEVSKDILVYAHSNELIEIDITTNRITLTPKGKYFVSKFSSNII
jgi:hypothetical protein